MSVRVAHRGRSLVTGIVAGTLGAQQVPELTVLARLRAPCGEVRAFDVARDGSRVASLGEDDTLVVRDLIRDEILVGRDTLDLRFSRVRLVPGADAVLLETSGLRLWRWDWRMERPRRCGFPVVEALDFVALDERLVAIACKVSGGGRVVLHDSGAGAPTEELVRREFDARIVRLGVDDAGAVLFARTTPDQGFALAADTLDIVTVAPPLPSQAVLAHSDPRGGLVVERIDPPVHYCDHGGPARHCAVGSARADRVSRDCEVSAATDVVRAKDGAHVARVMDAVAVATASTGPEFWMATANGARRWNAASEGWVGPTLAWPTGDAVDDGAGRSVARIAGLDDQSIVAVLRRSRREQVVVRIHRDESTTLWDFPDETHPRGSPGPDEVFVDKDAKWAFVRRRTGVLAVGLEGQGEPRSLAEHDATSLGMATSDGRSLLLQRRRLLQILDAATLELRATIALPGGERLLASCAGHAVLGDGRGGARCVPLPDFDRSEARKSIDRVAWCEDGIVVLATLRFE